MLKGGFKMVTKDQVMEALKKVYDPELGVSVVDLGSVSYTHLTLPTKRIV